MINLMETSLPTRTLIDLLDQARALSGMTGKALAARAQIAPETLSRLRTRGTGDFATVAKLMESADVELRVVPRNGKSNPHDRLDARSSALHAAVASKLLEDPGLIERKVIPNIHRFRMTHRHSGTEQLIRQWESAANEGALSVVKLCLENSPRGQQLRQTSPMTGILTDDERRQVYAAFSA